MCYEVPAEKYEIERKTHLIVICYFIIYRDQTFPGGVFGDGLQPQRPQHWGPAAPAVGPLPDEGPARLPHVML